MNRLYKSVSVLVGSVVAQRVAVNFQSHQYAFADSIPDNMKDIIVVKTEEDDDENLDLDPEKEDCPFCKHFLNSPCAKEFRRWSKCVDKCKEDESDFITVCENHTAKLLDCTSNNPEYFKEMASVTVEEDEGEPEEINEENSEVSDSIVVDTKNIESESEDKN